MLNKEVDVPARPFWAREDEMTQDYFSQSTFTRIKAGIDKSGKLISWHHRQGQINGSAREQCFSYQPTEHFKVDSYHQKAGTLAGVWQVPGHLQFTFATKSMIDEVAHAQNNDPLGYRLKLLGSAKEFPYRGYGASIIDGGYMAKCYQAAAELTNWTRKRPKGVALGTCRPLYLW